MALIDLPAIDLSDLEACDVPYSDVSVPELARRIEAEAKNAERRHNELRTDIREDIAALRSALQEAQLGLVAVVRYDVEQRAQDTRIAALEVAAQDARDQAERRKLAVVTSIVAPILVAILVSWLITKGVVQ